MKCRRLAGTIARPDLNCALGLSQLRKLDQFLAQATGAGGSIRCRTRAPRADYPAGPAPSGQSGGWHLYSCADRFQGGRNQPRRPDASFAYGGDRKPGALHSGSSAALLRRPLRRNRPAGSRRLLRAMSEPSALPGPGRRRCRASGVVACESARALTETAPLNKCSCASSFGPMAPRQSAMVI